MRGYKVVRVKENGFYFSVVSACIMVYKIGMLVNRIKKNGPLSVFEQLANAVHFASMYRGVAIFECEYKPSKDKYFWRINYEGVKRYIFCNFVPKGTNFAESVKLIRRVA